MGPIVMQAQPTTNGVLPLPALEVGHNGDSWAGLTSSHLYKQFSESWKYIRRYNANYFSVAKRLAQTLI